MSMVSNCDGESFVPENDPGRCKHGVYVGGCGWDLMCHWCEMGEDPPIYTAEDHFREFLGTWRQITNLNRIMAEESAYPSDPEAWASIMGNEAIRQMNVAIVQALLPDAQRKLALYHEAQESTIWLRTLAAANKVIYCSAEQFPGDPESPECGLHKNDPHESGVHMRFDATGGVSAEWDV